MTMPVHRRVAVALVSLVSAAILFRSEIASALVTRGDDRLRAGDVDGAVRVYTRAAYIDARSVVASDRLAFYLLLRRRPGDALRAHDVATAALQIAPDNPALLADRAFAAQRLRRWRDAEDDFIAAAAAGRDPRYAHLASRMALLAGDRPSARRHLRYALWIDAAYAPARIVLHRIGG